MRPECRGGRADVVPITHPHHRTWRTPCPTCACARSVPSAAPLRSAPPPAGTPDRSPPCRAEPPCHADSSEAQGAQRRRQRDLLRRPPGRVAGVAGRHLSRAAQVAEEPGLDRPVPAGPARTRLAGAGVRPARAGHRGRHPGPPAAEARAVRRHVVRRPEGRSLPGRDRGGRVRRGAPVRRPGLRGDGPACRGAQPGRGTAPGRTRSRAARPRYRGGALRDHGQGRRRVRAGGRRARERHRRDRDRGVPRRPEGVAAHLRAVP